MMRGGKDTAMIILGKKGKRHSEPHDDMDFDDDEYEEEEEMEEYSEEQFEMADELISAVKSGDPESVLDAIHGIYNSY